MITQPIIRFLFAISFLSLGGMSLADIVIPSDRVETSLNVRDLESGKVIAQLNTGDKATYIRSIPHYYIIELNNGVQGKVAKSWSERIKESPSTLKVATFNVKVFGPKKANNPSVLHELASIIRQYDIVAIQEIRDIKQRVPSIFLEAINTNGARYDYLLSERSGREPDDQDSQEQYAFYYNTETISPTGFEVTFDDSSEDLFQREPFIAGFRSVSGDLTFVLITIHTRPGSAVQEIRALDKVVHWTKAKYPQEDDIVLLGDFNAGCSYASESDFDSDPIKQNYHWVVPESADTNVSSSKQCPYDRIVISSEMIADFTKNWGIGTVSDKSVSDHYPVWAEFWH